VDFKGSDLRRFAVVAAIFIALMSFDLDRLSDTRPLEFGSSADLLETLTEEGIVSCISVSERAGVDDVLECRRENGTLTVVFFDEAERKERMLRDPASIPGPHAPFLIVGRTWIVTALDPTEAKRIGDAVGGYVEAVPEP
jgi:hypothetical protein